MNYDLDFFSRLSATDGAALVRSGELNPIEWAEASIELHGLWEPQVRAWAYLDEDLARRRARELSEVDWAALRPDPVLAGVPIGVKDVFNTRDMPTVMGSDIWAGFEPGNDARVVDRARLLGALILGKTVTAEFAVHTPGSTRNPHDADRITGTSSSGSAVAVACGVVPVALGTQTAGSIVRPASYIGVLGYKPSFGLIPRTGVLKTCDPFDTVGWFARELRDIRLLLDALRVHGRDYPNVEQGLARAARKRASLGPTGRPWRVALARTHTWELAEPYARRAFDAWAQELATRADVRLDEPDFREPLAEAHRVHRTIYHKSLTYYFKREREKAGERISPILWEIFEEGARISRQEYVEALDRQRELARRLDSLLAGYDVLVTLSVAGEAPRVDGDPEVDDSALIWTLCGAPALSVPLFQGPGGLPFGLQVVAPRYGDETLLEFGRSVLPGRYQPLRPRAVTGVG